MKADHQKISNLMKTVRGQIDGILRMIEDDRYCMDVAHQIMAAEAILRKANKEVLKAHMESCVKEAIENGDTAKIDELTQLIDRALP